MAYNNYNTPIIPSVFIKKIIQNAKTKKTIEKELIEFANKNKFHPEHTIYSFVKESLRINVFFNIPEDIRHSLLFDAIIYASLNETKSKIKPQNYKDIKEGKKDAYFINLQQELINSVYRNLDTKSFNFNIILDYYLNMFFELSCLKKGKVNDI